MKEKCKYDNVTNRFSILMVLCMALLFSCTEKSEKNNSEKTEDSVFYCPMHPEIMQNHPGKCPKPECKGMELVLKMSDAVLGQVLRPVNTSVLSSVKTIKPVYKTIQMDVEADGNIAFDDRTKNNISTLVNGRIEKLYVKYNYQPVIKGQKVLEIYSPELIMAQENFIYILSNDAEDLSLIEAAKQKLIQLGFTEELMNELVQTRKTKRVVPVYSHYNGFVYDSKPMKPASLKSNEMNSSKKENYESGNKLSIKEGQYVMMGETVFNVAANENLVVEFQIKPEDMSKIQKGQEIELIAEGEKSQSAKIDFIEPALENGKKTMTCRAYISNTKKQFTVGTLIKVKIKGEEFESLWIPGSALVDLGKEKIVWLKENQNFIAKKVETGLYSNGMIEIADGLTESDEIAMESHYLMDSEGFIKEDKNEE